MKGGTLAEYHGGLHGYLGALGALHARSTAGRGQHVDVSLLECVTTINGGVRQTLGVHRYDCPATWRAAQPGVPTEFTYTISMENIASA